MNAVCDVKEYIECQRLTTITAYIQKWSAINATGLYVLVDSMETKQDMDLCFSCSMCEVYSPCITRGMGNSEP